MGEGGGECVRVLCYDTHDNAHIGPSAGFEFSMTPCTCNFCTTEMKGQRTCKPVCLPFQRCQPPARMEIQSLLARYVASGYNDTRELAYSFRVDRVGSKEGSRQEGKVFVPKSNVLAHKAEEHGNQCVKHGVDDMVAPGV